MRNLRNSKVHHIVITARHRSQHDPESESVSSILKSSPFVCYKALIAPAYFHETKPSFRCCWSFSWWRSYPHFMQPQQLLNYMSCTYTSIFRSLYLFLCWIKREFAYTVTMLIILCSFFNYVLSRWKAFYLKLRDVKYGWREEEEVRQLTACTFTVLQIWNHNFKHEERRQYQKAAWGYT